MREPPALWADRYLLAVPVWKVIRGTLGTWMQLGGRGGRRDTTVDGACCSCVRDGEKEILEIRVDTFAVKRWSDFSRSKTISSCGFVEGH